MKRLILKASTHSWIFLRPCIQAFILSMHIDMCTCKHAHSRFVYMFALVFIAILVAPSVTHHCHHSLTCCWPGERCQLLAALCGWLCGPSLAGGHGAVSALSGAARMDFLPGGGGKCLQIASCRASPDCLLPVC